MRANYERFLHVAKNGDLPRTIFPMPSRQLTTFNEGQLVPIYLQEVLPNSTWSNETRALIRGATPIFNVMDDCYAETFYFYCPSRLLWKHWKNFLGENEYFAWDYNQPTYSVPQMTFDVVSNSNTVPNWTGELMDYFNIGFASYTNQLVEDDDGELVVSDTPHTVSSYNRSLGKLKVNALPFRMYNLVYNNYFRDENTTSPLPVNVDDTDENYFNAVDGEAVYAVRKACRYHDYFSSALPAPQKGTPSYVPMEGYLEVLTGDVNRNINSTSEPLRFYSQTQLDQGQIAPLVMDHYNTLTYETDEENLVSSNATSDDNIVLPRNLWAKLRSDIITVESLRRAIAVQNILELKSRGGSRYVELINSFFDCQVPDATIQIPEYLGGSKFRITQSQIIQTSSTDSVSPLGTVSAYSKTTDLNEDYEKSFTEHGFIMGFVICRVNRTYQQGLERMWKRKDFYDYYLPQLANLGEQPIYNYEIFATGSASDDEIFGYNEAQASYRFKPSMVSGMFRTQNNFGDYLDAYHYADFYKSKPYLSQEWMEEGTENIDRTLAVEAEKNHQFLADFYFNAVATLPIPYSSIPSIEAVF